MIIFSYIGILTVIVLSLTGLIRVLDWVSWKLPDLWRITGFSRVFYAKLPLQKYVDRGVDLYKIGPTLTGGSVYNNLGLWIVWSKLKDIENG